MKDDGQEYKHQGQDIKTNLRGLTYFNSQRLTRGKLLTQTGHGKLQSNSAHCPSTPLIPILITKLMFNLRRVQSNRKNSRLCGRVLNVTAGWKYSKRDVRNQLTLTFCHSLPELTDSSQTSVCFQYFSAEKDKNLRKNNNGTQGMVYHVNLDHRILRFIPSTFANHQCLAPIISILSEEFEIISWSASSDKDRRTNLLCRKALTGHLTVSYNRHKP